MIPTWWLAAVNICAEEFLPNIPTLFLPSITIWTNLCCSVNLWIECLQHLYLPLAQNYSRMLWSRHVFEAFWAHYLKTQRNVLIKPHAWAWIREHSMWCVCSQSVGKVWFLLNKWEECGHGPPTFVTDIAFIANRLKSTSHQNKTKCLRMHVSDNMNTPCIL